MKDNSFKLLLLALLLCAIGVFLITYFATAPMTPLPAPFPTPVVTPTPLPARTGTPVILRPRRKGSEQ